MSLWTKEAILSAPRLPRTLVTLPDGEVWVRELSVAEMAKLRDQMADGIDPFLRGLCLVATALCDGEDGPPMFGPDEILTAAQALAGGSPASIDRLTEAVVERNGLGEGALKEALGKSEPTESGSFSSDSAATSDVSIPTE